MVVLILIVGCGRAEPTPSPAPTSTPASTPTASDNLDTAWDDRAIFRSGLIDTEQEVLGRLPGASVYHIDFQVSDDFLLLEGHEEVHYTNQENEPLDEVYFRLFPNITGGKATVSAVQVDGQDVKPAYEFQDSALHVPLPTALPPGEQVVIQMDFEVEVAQEMGGNYGLFGYFDGVLVLDEFYPAIPVYDDESWNVEVPSRNGDVTYYDASFYLVRVTAPANLTVVASGIQVAREHEVDNQVLTFAAGPARDFYLAASEDYTVISETVGETTVNSYAFAARAEEAELALQFATDALRSYNECFGVYPYTEFDVVSTPMQALGMEYPGLVAIALGLYDPNEQAAGLPFPIALESTTAHEVAHQWFYNAVGNDQVDEPWLDEAIVQYLTGLYYVDTHGESAARDYRASWDSRWDRVERVDIPIGLPVAAYADKEYGAIVYGRGPLFVAALAEEMSQETLDGFLRDYYQSYKWGIGTSDAFRQLAEQHCQCDLTALFEEWVYEKTATPVPSTSTPAPPTLTATPAPPTATPPPAERASDGVVQGWAVLAQKDDYSDVDMTDILVDHIGITQMRQVLDDSGWDTDHVHELREFDRETLQDNLDWLAENADQDDVVFLYVAAHGTYLKKVLAWDTFFATDWAEIPSQRRLLVIDSCQAANYTATVSGDPSPHLSIAAVAGDEYAWSGLEEEGLPIIGGVFTHYFAAAFDDPDADSDGNGLVSVQEAALMAEGQQRTYMHDVVFAVPEFVEMYHNSGAFPDQDPAFPHVVVDDAIGEPLYLALPPVAPSTKESENMRITIRVRFGAPSPTFVSWVSSKSLPSTAPAREPSPCSPTSTATIMSRVAWGASSKEIRHPRCDPLLKCVAPCIKKAGGALHLPLCYVRPPRSYELSPPDPRCDAPDRYRARLTRRQMSTACISASSRWPNRFRTVEGILKAIAFILPAQPGSSDPGLVPPPPRSQH